MLPDAAEGSVDSGSAGSGDSGAASSDGRRILAIVLPELFLRAAGTEAPAPRAAKKKAVGARPPQAVVLLPQGRDRIEPTDQLAAVDQAARARGVRPGHTVTEARAFVAALCVLPLDEARLGALLLELAEVLRPFCAAIAISWPDALLLDVSGIAHLHGGELELCREISLRLRELGHSSQVALAAGPRMAEAVARMGRLDGQGLRIVRRGEEPGAMRELPLGALLPREQAAWFARLGLLDVAQLLELPPSTLSARLGPEAQRTMALARGQDDEPLAVCEFPREIELSQEWDDALVGLEPLLFVLRGVASRVSARLQGRGEAARVLELSLRHDPALSRYRGGPAETKLIFELSSPVHRDVELERILRTRLERTTLPAPTSGLFFRASRLCPQSAVQLELGTRGASRRLQELPVLISELETDVGAENLGILRLENAHAPEARARLEPLGPKRARPRTAAQAEVSLPPDPLDRATRLLATPVALSVPLRVGESFVLGRGYYTIEKLEFATRLDGIAWWTNAAQSRDYVWAWLSGSSGGLQALLFVDRRTRHAYVQGLAD